MERLKNKNILFLVHNYNNFQKDQIEQLAKYYNNVYVIVRDKIVTKISNYLPISAVKKFRKEYIIDLNNKPDNVTIFPAKIFYLPTHNSYKKAGERHFKSADKIIRNNGMIFDLIHAHFAWTSGYVGHKLKDIYNVPFVLTAHGYDIYRLPFQDPFYFKNIQAIINSANINITVGEKILENYNRMYIDSKSIEVIPNGFSKKDFSVKDALICREALQLPKDKTILLSIGSLEKVKGQDYLIDAFNIVQKSKEDIICVIIGDGSQALNLKKKIKKLNLKKKILLVGYKKHSELSKWINACDILVVPSLNESFGVVQIEAMACEKPIVATINGGSEQLISEGKNGLLCPRKNPPALAEKILLALEYTWNKKLISEYSKQYTWENVCKKIMRQHLKVL